MNWGKYRKKKERKTNTTFRYALFLPKRWRTKKPVNSIKREKQSKTELEDYSLESMQFLSFCYCL